jgi:DNA repair protein SbcD/Mre11
MTRRLKICHTSDWHLGHTLHGCSRELEHARFLSFLIDVLAHEKCDALIVAGDVFDTANPPASAQAMLYRFLADVRGRLPRLDVLIVAGNHDSAARLSAPDPILRALGVRVVGGVPRADRSAIDADAIAVPLHDRGGEVAAWVAAVPFLRTMDLPLAERASPEAYVEGVRAVYGAAIASARARCKSGQALLATGHCTMLDARPSELSERAIAGGVGVDVFPDDVAYVALGHLHYPQHVGDRVHVRYSGSPIPLAMPEETYPHQVRIVRFEGGALAGQEEVRVPRAVDVIRLPRDGADEIDAVIAQIERLELQPNPSREEHPFLEVRVRIADPIVDLRARIERAIGDRPVRLVKITIEHAKSNVALAESEPERDLAELSVEEVFRRCYARRFEGEPSEALMRAFAEIADAARGRTEGR